MKHRESSDETVKRKRQPARRQFDSGERATYYRLSAEILEKLFTSHI